MDPNTAAEAPVTETVAPVEALQETPSEPSLSERMSEIWNKDRTNNTPAETEEPQEVAPEQPAEKPVEEAKEEPVAKPQEAPGILPDAVKEAWADLNPKVQDAIHQSHQTMANKLRAQGREMQGINPIKEALVEAVKENPALANQRPEQVAREIQRFSREVMQPLEKNPVETLLKVAQERGVAEQLRARLGGEQSQAGTQLHQLNEVIRQQQQQIERLSDPNFLRDQITQVTQTNTVESTVQDFVSSAEHWETVEAAMPQFVEVAKMKLGDEASPTDVLKAAYEHAVSMFIPQPEPKAEAETAPQPAPLEADPETTQAAIKAKSVNVQSKSGGKTRELSLNEQLRKIYAKGQR